ncbi:MAG: MFS transporter [Prevotellaceae bacterium]|jgi:MFS family permease|nr:MFS transporter [Prevotellaceae bacterium]
MYNKSLVFTAACAGMAFFGVTMLSLGPILGALGSDAGILSPLLTVGIIMGTVVFGPVVDRFGYKWLLVTGSIFAVAGILGLARFHDMTLLSASIILLGFGGGILNGETNALVSDIYDDKRRGIMLSMLGACYCIGALLWTLLCTFVSYTYVLYGIAAVMAVFIIFFCSVAFPKAKPKENVSTKQIIGLLKYPALIVLAIVLFFQSGFEGISGDFTVSFLNKNALMDISTATFSMTVFSIGMLIGRFVLGVLMARMRDLTVFFIYLSIALVGTILLNFASGESAVGMAYTGMALIGFGIGATYPVILNYLGAAFKQLSGSAFSIALFIALFGGIVFKSVVAGDFETCDLAIFPILLIVAVIAMMLVAPFAVKLSKRVKS